MPWITDELKLITKNAKNLIEKYYNFPESISILLCTAEEMKIRVSKEIEQLQLSKKKKELLFLHVVSGVIGKYFNDTEEIWLVSGGGDNIAVLTHELLHSIQKCTGHREGIVEYLTFKLTNGESSILDSIKQDWMEIEKTYGFEHIKLQLLREEDCEEF